MKPLVAGPAFVRALDELVAAAKLGPPPDKLLDVDVRGHYSCKDMPRWPSPGRSIVPRRSQGRRRRR